MSLLNDLFGMLDARSLADMTSALGQPDKSVASGLRSAIATVLGGLAVQSNNPSVLRETLQFTPPATEGVSWPNAATAMAEPESAAMSTGRRILSTLFGDSLGSVARALGVGTGLQTGAISSLLAMAAPMVTSYLGRRVRNEGMSMTALGNLLQHEMPAIRSALPAGVTDLLWPHEQRTAAAQPVVVQTATAARPSKSWLLPLVLIALLPAFLWLIGRGRTPSVATSPVANGTANRAMPEAPTEVPKPSPLKSADLYFSSGSMNLLPESEAKLKDLAESVKADPSAHIAVSGYTDNVGNATANLRLSQQRADAVQADIVRMGIPSDRVSAQGFGEENAIADNATAEGRATNRRVSVMVGER